jgi:hypothetical protein
MQPIQDAQPFQPPPASSLAFGAAASSSSGATAPSPGLCELERALAAFPPETLLVRESAAGDALRAAAHLLAAEARAADPVRAERLLIALRRAWRELPEVESLPGDGARRALWDRFVRLCCEEFYAPARAAASPAGPTVT